jgi:hypothetical protein
MSKDIERLAMLNSDYRKLCEVKLPYAGRRKYMHTFDLAAPVMAKGFEDYLEPVKALCAAAGAVKGIAHMTVDEKIVVAGMSQRRPKPHVDGCFMPAIMDWGHGNGGGGWLHGCNNIPLKEFKRMSVIVASNAVGCRAWRGQFDTEPKNDGDLSHLSLGEGEVIPAHVGYLLNADCVHESMIQAKEVQRSFLRIALPVDFKF